MAEYNLRYDSETGDDILDVDAGQIQSDWNQTDISAVDYIKNKPNSSNTVTCKLVTFSNILLDGSVTSIGSILLSNGDLVLVNAQTDKKQNGVYTVNSSGWTRTATLPRYVNADSNIYDNYVPTSWVLTGNPIVSTNEITYQLVNVGSGYEGGSFLYYNSGRWESTQGFFQKLGYLQVKQDMYFMTGRLGIATNKGAGKIFVSDSDGWGSWLSLIASTSSAGIVEIATQTEFDSNTDQNGSNYLVAPVSMIKRAIPPMKHVIVGSDVLIDANDADYAVCTLNIPSASWKYEIEFTLYTEFATDTTDMQFILVRSNNANLSEIRGVITQTAQDGTLYPTNSRFWEGSSGDWAGADLLNLQTMQRTTFSDTFQIITLKAFIQPTAALDLVCYARKNNGGQCKIKKRTFATAKAFN